MSVSQQEWQEYLDYEAHQNAETQYIKICGNCNKYMSVSSLPINRWVHRNFSMNLAWNEVCEFDAKHFCSPNCLKRYKESNYPL